MPPVPAVNRFIPVEEYIEGELRSEVRHEYVDGQVYAMGGASRSHGLVVNALAFALTPAARSKHCQLFTSDMKVRLNIADKSVFYYPDLLLSCNPADRDPYFCSQPCLIVEVLSESTERIDRREKLLAYQSLPSLQEYVLVAQDVKRVEIYRRSKDWRTEYVTSGGEVRLDCLDVSVTLDAIYADVEWG
ncbi:MAG: Uma2 family endonuclease [Sulfuricellaceae bacterium]|nr:Uma2 family endonuclease [Sulfuricellaceae bacterium]